MTITTGLTRRAVINLIAAGSVFKHVRLGTMGLEKPNPGIVRIQSPPRVMVTPPTVATSAANAASPLPGIPVILDAVDPRIRYYGATAVPNSGTGIRSGGVAVSTSHPPIVMEFMTDAPMFAVSMNLKGQRFRLRVNGEYATAHSVDVANTSAYVWLSFDFGSREYRHIEIEWDGDARLWELSVGATDTVGYPTAPLGPRVVVLGDSWASANGTVVSWRRTFPYSLGDALGWRDMWAQGIGGTGYINSALNYVARVQSDVIDHEPDVVIVTGGVNDLPYTAAAITEAAGAVFDAILAGLPDAVLIVVEPFTTAAAPIPNVPAAVAAAATARSLPYVQTDGWLTGTGSTASPNGTGNADYYITNFHPSESGSAFLGRKLATAIGAMIESGAFAL